jgi:hypothetical protein
MAHLWIRGEGGWRAPARLIRVDAGAAKIWALIAPNDAGVRVNSRPVSAGLRVLADKDEIRVGGEVRYFSTETLAAVEPFPAADRPVYCGRCRQVIEAGSAAVCCPGCNIWYHQRAKLPCFTYAEKCTFCDHATSLNSGFVWIPEGD